MDSRRHADDSGVSDTALDFVRFCHRRRRVGWPELYDEMCAVASRGVYRGWGFRELGDHGVAFGLTEMPHLARLVATVALEDLERKGRVLVGIMSPVPACIGTLEESREDELHARVLVGSAG